MVISERFAFQLAFTCLQVVFAGFSSESLAQRIMDCKPKVVITSNAVKRGPKAIHLKDIVDAALDECAKSGISVGVYFNVIAFLIRTTRYLLSFM